MASKKTSLVEVMRRVRQVHRDVGDKNLAMEAIREMREEVSFCGATDFFDWIEGTSVDAARLSIAGARNTGTPRLIAGSNRRDGISLN